ncbi:MAG: hypothetical protein ACLGIF_03050 [Actinomycetes bacterium]
MAVRAIFERLVDDAAVFPPGNAPVERAVVEHLAGREAWYAPVVGPLVVRDSQLAAVATALRPTSDSCTVSVVNTSGAGGLLALARRRADAVTVVAVESALRDVDDLPGNARRVVAAAGELDPEVTVFVELPYAPGWPAAAAVVEEAGHLAKIRTGGLTPDDVPAPAQLADQLSVLVEADLAFKATAGLHHAWPTWGPWAGEELVQHGFLTLLIAVHALVEGADAADAADILRWSDRGQIADTVAGWNDADAARVRRRFRSFGCCGVTDPVTDLETLGLLRKP